MFDIDKWQEIWHSITKHKLRTFLTGFGVAWGIFVLMILLGSGNGLYNGITSKFESFAKNSITVFGGMTKKNFKGLPRGRLIQPRIKDLKKLKRTIPEIKYLSPILNLNNTKPIIYNRESASFTVDGIANDFFYCETLKVLRGRLLNKRDHIETRKTAIIGEKIMKVLFAGTNPIGKYISINNENFKIVGLVKQQVQNMFSPMDSRILIPYQTLLNTFNQDDRVHKFSAIPYSNISAKKVEDKIRMSLSRIYQFDPTDENAVWIQNMEENSKMFDTMFSGVSTFLWIIGLCSMLGGMVGVSNIMLVTVKDRTKEIGIRKALGATPFSIVSLILQESIIITVAAGAIGIIIGIAVLKLISLIISSIEGTGMEIFKNPSIGMNTAIAALILLIAGGLLAGYIPSKRAAKISPIESLRYE